MGQDSKRLIFWMQDELMSIMNIHFPAIVLWKPNSLDP
jgi:hypothetical protein